MKGGGVLDFDEIYRLYFRDICRYIYSLCRNESTAEEVTQETFFKALRSIEQFDSTGDIRAWLFTIAKNTYFSLCRKDCRIENTEQEDRADEVCFVDRIVDEERADLIHRFLHTMEEPYKEVFTLRVFGELPFEKIGSLFGKSAGWARVTFHRAKEKIRNYMEEMCEYGNQL